MYKEGDVVARVSYGKDVLFRVIEVYKNKEKEMAVLKGLDMRLVADAPVSDLVKVEGGDVKKYQEYYHSKCQDCKKSIFRRRQKETEQSLKRFARSEDGEIPFFEDPGKVLHIDGDEEYLRKCMNTYQELGIKARGECIAERNQPKEVMRLLTEDAVDILVLTGHDGFLKGKKDFADLNSYRNSRYFVEAVRAARRLEPSKDELVIFAGACQSHYEAILAAGANFASSPLRVLIHAFDPVFIVEKVAFSPINEKLSLKEVIADTITGTDGVGGVETRGRFRLGYPKSPY